MKKLMFTVCWAAIIGILISGTVVYWSSLYFLILTWDKMFEIFLTVICLVGSFLFYLLAKEDNEQTATTVKAYCNRILSFLNCMNNKEEGVSIIPSKISEVPTICKTLGGSIKANIAINAKADATVIHSSEKN